MVQLKLLTCHHIVQQVLKHLEGARNPLPPPMHNFYILIETTGSDESSDK